VNQIERELREALNQRVEMVEPPPDFDQRVSRRVTELRSRRRVVLMSASGVAVAIAALAVLLIARDGSRQSHVLLTDVPTSTAANAGSAPTTSAGAPADDVARARLSLDGPRQRTQPVWTGDEIVIWGGYDEGRNRVFADGAAFNPTNRTWRVLSSSPFNDPGDTTLSVWAGDRVVFVTGNQAASWLPQSNRWERLPDLTGAKASGKLIWTGDVVIAAGNNVALRLGDANWRSLPEPPLRLARVDYDWTGTALLVTGASAGTVHIQQYDPQRNVWDSLPASDLSATATDASWNGKELIVVNYDNSAAAYDPTLRRWRNLVRIPARFMENIPTVVATPTLTAAFMAQTIAILDERNEWTPLPYNDFTRAGQGLVSTIDGSIWSVGIDPREDNGYTAVSFNPSREIAALKAVQVGVATVELGAFTYQGARFDGKAPGPETTTVRLLSSAGVCAVTSTYVGSDPIRTGTPTSVSIAGNKEIAARQVSATAVEIDYTTSDIVRAECPDPQTTINLLRQVHPPTAR
jgi:hypothetical protein